MHWQVRWLRQHTRRLPHCRAGGITTRHDHMALGQSSVCVCEACLCDNACIDLIGIWVLFELIAHTAAALPIRLITPHLPMHPQRQPSPVTRLIG